MSKLGSGDRRLEADSYLASGFGIRMAIESHARGWVPLGTLVRNSQPPRLKGIEVGPERGRPYLSATQVFDLRPASRKFLSLHKVKQAALLSVSEGDILVTRSGTVGRATLAHLLHTDAIVSDDLIRVSPRDGKHYGWVYAFLRSASARKMMASAHYGHVIKHLETAHLDALPIPIVDNAACAEFNALVGELRAKRAASYRLMLDAEQQFEDAIGSIPRDPGVVGFEVLSSVFASSRRRLEACYHTAAVTRILGAFRARGLSVSKLSDVTERVWWMTRFSRVYGEGGIPYLSADELFTLNPTISKFLLTDKLEEARAFYVKQGWLVMACSGQTYGLNGSVSMVTEKQENCFFSHDLVRIIPNATIRPGYLLVALSHPRLGRPLVVRNAYGSSIPHLDPEDVRNIPIVRLQNDLEFRIGEAAENAIRLRSEADQIENELADKAERMVLRFLETNPSGDE